ncbi:MAG: ABC transporter substrate-binding protein [Vicinamibacteria bacterium]|nr:ABC transporter substrate-binding protein [Vicinamibacteria bacterium]
MRARPTDALALAALTVASLAAGGCQRPAPLDIVRIAVPYGPADLWSHTSADEVTNSVLRSAYEPLTDVAADLRIVPCLAESWHNPDDLTWEFRLRPGVRLHDGTPLTPEHVVAFFRRVLADPSTQRSPVHLLASVDTAGADSVRMRTRRPVGWLPSQLARLLIATEQPGSPIPLGTGPYRVTRWSRGGEVELEALPDHRDGRPAVARVVFEPIADPAEATRRLLAGNVQLVPEPDGQAWDQLRADPAIRTHERPSLRVLFLGLNSLADSPRPALRDLRVRQALRRALDPAEWLATMKPPPGVAWRELVPPEVVGSHGQLHLDPADPDAARALLEAAGWMDLELSLDFEARRYPGIERTVEGVIAQLGRAGVRVVARPRESGSRLQRETAELFLIGWLHSSGDAAASYEYIVHSPAGQSRGGLSTYSNPEVDRLLAEAALPITGEARQRLLRQVAERVHDDVAVIPLLRTYDRYAFDARLDFTPRLDRRIRGQDLRPAKR